MMRTNYSGTKCPKCEFRGFEMAEDTPVGSNFIVMYIRCSSCKTLVTALEYSNSGSLIRKLAKGLNLDLDRISL